MGTNDDGIPCLDSMFQAFKHNKQVDPKSYGVVFNSFYVEHCRNVVGRKSWNVGHGSTCNKMESDKKAKGGGDRADEVLKWLDGKNPRSILFMYFSSGVFTTEQLRKMALGLEASGHPFIWAARNVGEDWIPEEFADSIEGRGLVFRGLAPQLLILNHAAVGGFVTYCGRNSSMLILIS
ncbi:hypothetical protein HPP92_008141 [Vanilla planifolia]|uniref:Uncharacterized protein n=1 Tax=Vanilla planifolia TaxID=51239 RepID=A0A835RBD5_VANPL|nr:hypothetical protein HPP92_008303 [Vanilla planifolia]KAG0486046.1 hypothetical protein HPP92_008141 [Vanilla planifolia]